MKTKALVCMCLLAMLAGNGVGLKNPDAVYCVTMGYSYVVQSTPEGEQGVCKFPDGQLCGGRDFLLGKCGEKYGYCVKNGYGQREATGAECDSQYDDTECAVCIQKDGKIVEITKLMNLSLNEGSCGDGYCTLGENHQTCSKDCPASGLDLLCEPIKDDICDPDCRNGEDPDCPPPTTTPLMTQTTSTTTFPKNNKCGNGICETGYGENYVTCPQDCPAGIADGYCDKLKDGFCDPDCPPGADPDCAPAPTTTTLSDCGNGACDAKENHGNCPSDCRSGGRDGYCDAVSDGVCDSDCPGNLDPDCRKSSMGYMDYLMYVGAFILVVIAIIMVYSKIKGSR